jgi:hypothetical protein
MTVTEVLPRAASRPRIRLRPAPPCDPPFDDELSPDIWAPANQLAFEWPVAEVPRPETPDADDAWGPGAGPAGGGDAGRRSVAGRSDAPGSVGGVVDGARAEETNVAVAGMTRDARLAVRRFVHLAVEVLNGHRPAAQLRRLAHPMDASRVVAQAIAGAHRVNEMRRAARPADHKLRRPSPVGVLGVHFCEPRAGAVEAAVLLETGERTWAMALRLEFHREAWAATVLRLI